VGNAIPVVNCETPQVRLMAAEDLYVVVKKEDADKLEITPQLPAFIQPPVSAGTVLGEARIQVGGKPLGTTPLVAAIDLPEAGWRWRLIEGVLQHAPPALQTR
jgi:D-alanyl-D-alanine carboxypeptidase